MKPFLIVNPRSANGATGRHFDDIARAVRGAIGDHAHAFTKAPMDATAIARRAIQDGHDLIIAVGGDGTINEVANGFFAEGSAESGRPVAINPAAAFAILPRGTGGDLRRTLGLDGDVAKSALRLREKPRPFDLGLARYVGLDGKPGARIFANVAGAGIDAEIVEIANRSSKVLGGKLSFMIASLRGLIGWRDRAVRFSLDGGPMEDKRITCFAVGNGRFFGGGMMVTPEARIDDGLFHLTLWSGFGFKDFAISTAKMYDGSHVKLSGTRTATARTVRLEPGEGDSCPVELDGEPVGRLPASFTILPGVVPLVA